MQNETSFQTYHQIKTDGTLAVSQLMVYEDLMQHPQSTDKEIMQRTGLKINQVTGRRNDLFEMKIVKKDGRKDVQNENGKLYPNTMWSLHENLTALKIKNNKELWEKKKGKVKKEKKVKDMTILNYL